MNKKDILVCVNLCKEYGQTHQTVRAVQDVSISIHEGEFCIISGKSGCGKSTLLRLLSGMERPTSGEVHYDKRNLYEATGSEQAKIRGVDFGFVFQAFLLIPELSVYDNIALPRILNQKEVSKQEICDLATKLDIYDKLDNYPHQLSGGQQQRVALARAFINEPAIIFADEPTGNLDEHNRDIVLNILQAYGKEKGKSVVMVSHDKELQKEADRLYSMRDGRVEA